MILRKPYAFLIKHFKLIHLIMTFCMGILIYQTNTLLEFFKDFISSGQAIIGTATVNNLFNNYTYLLSAIIIFVSLVILILMIFKNKPKFYYMLNILGYTLLIVLYIYAVSTIGDMQEGLVDERITRAIRDFLNIIFVFQVYSLLISLVRSIGLDVKKFDFNQDMQELNISDLDNEEFEVNIDFDSNTLKTKFRRFYRNLKYYFIENKLTIIILSCVGTSLFGLVLVIGLFERDVVYNTGQMFSPLNYNITVIESYITDKDYRLNKVTTDDKSLVVVKFKIKSLNKTPKFIFGKLSLQIGEYKYYHINTYSDKLKDLGITYINQNLTEEFQEYLLVYEVPKVLIENEMKLVYTEQVVEGVFKDKSDAIIVRINPVVLEKAGIEDVINLNQNYMVGTGILANYELRLNEFEIAKKAKLYYEKCITLTECYTFYDVVQPALSGIEDKAVLKLNMSLNTPDNALFNLKQLVTLFGSLEYEVDGLIKKQLIHNAINTTHTDKNYYFEIKSEVLLSESVNLVFRVRNNVYRFKLK
ncbi:MAG: hypothetical protein E7173_01735 [Firmicutes bacterium]|nr:hypothetical protein [Bacillota bacterium]